jgi:hypothetical protein
MRGGLVIARLSVLDSGALTTGRSRWENPLTKGNVRYK